MKRQVKGGILAGMILCLLPGAWCSQALAEEERITKVSLEITTDFEPGDSISEEDIQIHTDSSLYKIDEWRLLNEESAWEGAAVPVVEIVLSQAEEAKFSYIGADHLTVKGTRFTFLSSKRSEKDTILNLKIKLPPIKEEVEQMETSDIWLDANGILSWPIHESVSLYRILIYRGGNKIGEKLSYGTLISIQDQITQPGNYSVKISGVSKYDGTEKTLTQRSEAVSFDIDMMSSFQTPSEELSGSWMENSGLWYYVNPGDHLAVAQWQEIDGFWYYFDHMGVRKTGWIDWNKSRYYCDENGKLLTDQVTPDGYRVGADGAVIRKEN